MKCNRKILVVSYVILLVLWFIGSQILIVNGVYFIFGKEAYNSIYEEHRYFMNLCAQIICLSVVLGIDYKYRHFEIKEWDLKFSEVLKFSGIGILVYLACIVINMILLPYFPGYTAISEMFTGYEPILSFTVIVFVAPILEEYIFRGKVQSLMRSEFSTPIAITTQALLFGSLHALALQKIYAVIMGCLFGIIKAKSNKLQCTIIVHMTVNFIGWLIGFYIAT
ncbi:CPBP family intramembrane glutamic endopeptidase [Cellulosilyticum ruminicola]|uniref:CPBP family intramembrane glutamic endopeptidase n=1 Tax=Cellulosilyticum ruminicola TaxID=425254 RepID=UPI0006CFE190|nr:type II CAAX endopeptidase family protein [Cellulosilyticum ruminicola]